MNSHKVVVIDYGLGNLLSVQRGFEHFGANVKISADPSVILSCSRVVLPGVGAFANGMNQLRFKGLDEIVLEVASRGIPLLGICLGMQMLLDESEEFGVNSGLGLVPGRVVAVPSQTTDSRSQKIPHIGWNGLVLPQGRENWKGTLMCETKIGEAAYFVHSFMAVPNDTTHRLADCTYGGRSISSVIAKDNVYGCQFHPEKSGKVGLTILKRFLSL